MLANRITRILIKELRVFSSLMWSIDVISCYMNLSSTYSTVSSENTLMSKINASPASSLISVPCMYLTMAPGNFLLFRNCSTTKSGKNSFSFLYIQIDKKDGISRVVMYLLQNLEQFSCEYAIVYVINEVGN